LSPKYVSFHVPRIASSYLFFRREGLGVP
jgi:hypothetical protein